VLSRADGTAQVAFTRSGDYELIGPGTLAATFGKKLSADQTLASDGRLASGLKPLPPDRLAWLYLPSGGSGALANLPAASTFTLTLRQDALALDATIPLPAITPLAAALAKASGPDLNCQLTADAVLALTFNANAKDWSAIWPHLVGDRVVRMLKPTGLDVDRDFLANLQPGAFFSLALAPTAQLGAGMPSLDVRRTNPFRYVQMAAAGSVKDTGAADKTLALLAHAAPNFGGHAEPLKLGEVEAYITGYAQGESTDFARVGDEVVAAAPRSRFEEAIARAQKKPAKSPFSGALQDTLTQEAVGAVADLDQARAGIRALPSSAWGVGGFAIRATAMRWLDATGELKAVTFGVHSEGGVAHVSLQLRFAR
jgi:hypothetical protein